eukprot:GSA25T00000258001.1
MTASAPTAQPPPNPAPATQPETASTSGSSSAAGTTAPVAAPRLPDQPAASSAAAAAGPTSTSTMTTTSAGQASQQADPKDGGASCFLCDWLGSDAAEAPAKAAAEETTSNSMSLASAAGSMGLNPVAGVGIAIVLVLLLCCCCWYFNWRRITCIRKTLLCIGWDKFEKLELVISVHAAHIVTTNKRDEGKYCVKISAGGKDYWTPQCTKTGHFTANFNVTVPQGYRKIVVEAYTIEGSQKLRMAQRIVDVLETIVARRPYGCVRHESFSIVKKTDGIPNSLAEGFSSGRVVLSAQYKEDVDKQTTDQIREIEDIVQHPISGPLSGQLSKYLGTRKKLESEELVEAAQKILQGVLIARIRWVSRLGMLRTKY